MVAQTSQMPPFFIPTGAGPAGEHSDQQLRLQTEAEMGRPPSHRRILELWMRRDNRHCVTTVGAPDPVWGGSVTAIFDMGPHQPFVVYREDPADPLQQPFDVLGCNAYPVSEFAP